MAKYKKAKENSNRKVHEDTKNEQSVIKPKLRRLFSISFEGEFNTKIENHTIKMDPTQEQRKAFTDSLDNAIKKMQKYCDENFKK